MSKELMLDVGQANEIKLAARSAGFTNEDLKTMCREENMVSFREFLRGRATLVPARVCRGPHIIIPEISFALVVMRGDAFPSDMRTFRNIVSEASGQKYYMSPEQVSYVWQTFIGSRFSTMWNRRLRELKITHVHIVSNPVRLLDEKTKGYPLRSLERVVYSVEKRLFTHDDKVHLHDQDLDELLPSSLGFLFLAQQTVHF